jgi:hypothetical protein
LQFFSDKFKIGASSTVTENFGNKVFLKKLQICNMPKAILTDAQRSKNRRQSRGPEDIRRDLDLQNAARLRASQRSQNSEHDISANHHKHQPSSSSSSTLHHPSSSCSSALNKDIKSETS